MDWLFGWLYGPIGTMLSWFSSLFGGSYALALLLYALLFKIVFLPFSIKQQKNQIKMAKLAPKIELIKAKYRGRTEAAAGDYGAPAERGIQSLCRMSSDAPPASGNHLPL